MLRRLLCPTALLALVLIQGPVRIGTAQEPAAPAALAPLQDAPLADAAPVAPQELPANDAAQSVAAPAAAPCDNCREGEANGAGHAGGRGGRLAGVLNAGAPANGCRDWGYGSPDLFYNFYAAPSCNGVGAYLYVSPLPIPAHVGHTYITYQPLMPHEFLYPHHRTYHRYYDEGRGLTRTSVHYYNPPVRTGYQHVHNMFKIAR